MRGVGGREGVYEGEVQGEEGETEKGIRGRERRDGNAGKRSEILVVKFGMKSWNWYRS